MKIGLGAIFVVLLVLKLTATVSWSWWIIFLPLYPVFFVLGLAGTAAIFAFVIALFTS